MARPRKEKTPAGSIKLRMPDRSAPTEKTLFDLAEERHLFQQAAVRERQKNDDAAAAAIVSPGAERLLEAALWTATLAMLHFTFDVLVHHQYGTEIVWPALLARTATAWTIFLFLFYFLHPHDSSPVLVPLIPLRHQRPLRQAIFFAMSVASGCHLIYVSNTYGYLATMKQAPPLGCLWLWAVVELDLPAAVLSLVLAGLFLRQGGYEIK
ncbi:deacetylase-like protein [Hirsutella rhossiliensis]|uniref:Deacetylase-like protein n=1 Tax=Hirsutella rhossiliensis TaxID=111463 RepID=A0A9P8MW83_9HYPO|nr:deacetylase-like protein [Hirsutella rhossiliensis]KAH0961376.1 deacetylase-like protein [Hirsutella rhossiliensis]